MMGFLKLFSRNKPKIKMDCSKKEGFDGWIKCSSCSEMMHGKELEQNLNCCPKCHMHYPVSAKERIELLADASTFKELFISLAPVDALSFVDSSSYQERIQKAQQKTKRLDGFYAGECTVFKRKVALGVMDFSFMGGSMGSVVGEKITRLIEHATEHQLPVVIVSCSGGARMQESCLSLMQMAKTSAALARLEKKKLPFISVLTNPTTGGVTASFASLGDVIIAEPDALIGFAGPRVVEQTIRQKLPERAQKAEFLLEKGMVDVVCPRKELKEKISFFIEFFLKAPLENTKVERAEKLDAEKSPFPDKLSKLLSIAKDLKSKRKRDLTSAFLEDPR